MSYSQSRIDIVASFLRCGTLAIVLIAPALAQRYVPPEVGKHLVERTCTGCHALSVVTSVHKTDAQWEVTLNQMLAQGAQATDDEAEIIYNYLCDNYGADSASASGTTKININQATAEQLQTTATASVYAASKSGDLRIVVVDVEGGAAALFVTPEGQSLLIDTGWPPSFSKFFAQGGTSASTPITTSADRIAAAAASLGVTKIDFLLMTHYHVDHLGGLDALLQKMPVGTFIDHGPNRESLPANADPRQIQYAPATIYPQWEAALKNHSHITAQTGQHLKIGSLEIEFVASDGRVLESPLAGAGQANPFCAGVPAMDRNGGEENVRSLGVLMTFGRARILDLGDLTWNKEMELLCPVNKVGKVDLYFVTGHGMNLSSSPPTAALDPLVAVMQNGPAKGGDEEVGKTLHTYPDLQGLWLAHASVRNRALNTDPNYIANLDQKPDNAYAIDIEITQAGKITVTNPRNQFSKTYMARAAQ